MKNYHLNVLLGILMFISPSIAQACPECWWDSFATPDMSNNRQIWPHSMPSMRRHHYVMTRGIPEDYRFLLNPIALSDTIVRKGKKNYEQHCVICHGDRGRGDGATAYFLTPQPADLKGMSHIMTMATDNYMYWAITEGGMPIGSDMPAFKKLLSEDEIWSVIHYIEQEISTDK